MNQNKFDKFIKENRPTPAKVEVDFEKVHKKAINREINPFPVRNVFAAMAVLVCIVVTFKLSKNESLSGGDVELAQFLEETFTSPYVNDYDSGDDYLSFLE